MSDRLQQATLAKAFRSELVPQEPAEVLCSDIQSDQQALPKAKKVKSNQKPREL